MLCRVGGQAMGNTMGTKRDQALLSPEPSGRRTGRLRRDARASARAAPLAQVVRDIPSASETNEYGICISGGGVRASAYGLGVLQEMSKKGMLHGGHKATYLSSVSGGSYVAGALAIVQRGEKLASQPNVPSRGFSRWPDSLGEALLAAVRWLFAPLQGPLEPLDVEDEIPVTPTPTLPAFAPGSPEEKYLRNHTRYLSHGWLGPAGAVWRLFMGILWNFLILTLTVGTIFVVAGWLYGAIIPALQSHCVGSAAACTHPHRFRFPDFLYQVPIGLVAASILFGLLLVYRPWPREFARRLLLSCSLGLLVGALVWVASTYGMSFLLLWIREGFNSGNVQPSASHGPATVGTAGGIGIVGSILTALAATRIGRTMQSGYEMLPTGAKTSLKSYAGKLLLRLRVPLVNLMAALLGPATVLTIAVFATSLGALFPVGTGSPHVGLVTTLWVIVLVVAVVVWLTGDVTTWSMHPFYRERLSASFVLKRFVNRSGRWSPTTTPDADGTLLDATRRPYDEDYLLSSLDGPGRDFPESIICAAANVSSYGATPTGSRVTSFVFSVPLIGGPIVGSRSAADYEAALSHARHLRSTVTLPAAMAISGAALSPEMGRMTRAPMRFLLTLFNIRLGVWLPNPNRLDEFSIRQSSFLGRLRLRPRPWYLVGEMCGWNRLNSKFLYVTDGGHYENLGLVELLRRRCRFIWCVDASGDQQGTFSTLAGALRLANSELGCRIDIDPEKDMAPDPAVTKERAALGKKPVVQSTFCVGTTTYSDAPGDTGTLILIKAGVPSDAPEDIAQFYETSAHFPCDSTLDQLYTSDRFDAYRSLGGLSFRQAWEMHGDEFKTTLGIP